MSETEDVLLLLSYINATPTMQSLLYDIDLMPEQLDRMGPKWEKMLTIADHWRARELGWQKGEHDAQSAAQAVADQPTGVGVVEHAQMTANIHAAGLDTPSGRILARLDASSWDATLISECAGLIRRLERELAARLVELLDERKARKEEKTRLLAAFEKQYKRLDDDLRPQLKDANTAFRRERKARVEAEAKLAEVVCQKLDAAVALCMTVPIACGGQAIGIDPRLHDAHSDACDSCHTAIELAEQIALLKPVAARKP